MKARQVTFIVEKDPERGYNARAIRHSIITQGDTLKEIRRMIPEAVNCHFEAEDRPSVIRMRFRNRVVVI
jgi:predicted RNase H-like HicB family nuclease